MKKEDALNELDIIWNDISNLKEQRLELKTLLTNDGFMKTEIEKMFLKMSEHETLLSKKVLNFRNEINKK